MIEAAIIWGVCSALIGFLLADRYRRQGHSFWQVLILSSIAFFAIGMMIYSAISGDQFKGK